MSCSICSTTAQRRSSKYLPPARRCQGLLQGLELGVYAEESETPESREFNEILEKEGAKAALAWQEARLARDTAAQ